MTLNSIELHPDLKWALLRIDGNRGCQPRDELLKEAYITIVDWHRCLAHEISSDLLWTVIPLMLVQFAIADEIRWIAPPSDPQLEATMIPERVGQVKQIIVRTIRRCEAEADAIRFGDQKQPTPTAAERQLIHANLERAYEEYGRPMTKEWLSRECKWRDPSNVYAWLRDDPKCSPGTDQRIRRTIFRLMQQIKGV